MGKVIVMPKLGLTMTEGTIDAWKKNEGDAVKEGEVLFSVNRASAGTVLTSNFCSFFSVSIERFQFFFRKRVRC